MPRSIFKLVLMASCLLGGSTAFAEKYTLEEPVDDERVFGVGLRLDVAGKVQTRGEANKTVDLPLTASAAISYRERRLLNAGSNAERYRAVREYEQAQVDIEVAEEKTNVTLPEALKLVVVQGRSSGLELYSLGGLFSAEEVELLTPPCDSLGLVALLPLAPVEIGDEWTPSSWLGQFLARLEASTKSDVKCTLASVAKDIARISFTAKVHGATQGAPSEVSINGTLDYDLAAKAIVAADISQTEKRDVGAVSVGLDVSARLRLLRKQAQLPGRVATPAVTDAASKEPPASALLLRFESPWTLSLLHARSWHLFKQTDQVAIFRLLDEGLFIAQANLSPIPAAEPGQHTSEKIFENDIRQSLGEKLKSLSVGEVLPNKERRFVYRIVAEGVIGERPITWIYFLLADPSGKQASLMVAVDRDLAPKLGNRDREFAEAIRFGVPATTAILKTPPPR